MTREQERLDKFARDFKSRWEAERSAEATGDYTPVPATEQRLTDLDCEVKAFKDRWEQERDEEVFE